MQLHERQEKFIARYAIIPDPQERLAAITSRKSTLAPLAPEERFDALLVPGCVSRVWIACAVENGNCRFRMDAESALVAGLVSLLCELYDNAAPAEVVATEPQLLERLGIAANLSPTRLNGLAHVRGRIREFAEKAGHRE